MAKSRAPVTDHARINHDLDGTFIYYAEIAARNEASGSHSTAESFWLKAMRVAVKPINREWADRRAAMCKQLATKWSVKP